MQTPKNTEFANLDTVVAFEATEESARVCAIIGDKGTKLLEQTIRWIKTRQRGHRWPLEQIKIAPFTDPEFGTEYAVLTLLVRADWEGAQEVQEKVGDYLDKVKPSLDPDTYRMLTTKLIFAAEPTDDK